MQDPLYSAFIYAPSPPTEEKEEGEDELEAIVEFRTGSKWSYLTAEARTAVTDRIENILQKRLANAKKRGIFTDPLLPRIHGTLVHSSKSWEGSFASSPKKETVHNILAGTPCHDPRGSSNAHHRKFPFRL